jgi:hypothetical protein
MWRRAFKLVNNVPEESVTSALKVEGPLTTPYDMQVFIKRFG